MNDAFERRMATGLTETSVPADLLQYLEELISGLPDGPELQEIIPAIREGRPLRVDATIQTRVSEQLAAEIIGIDPKTMLKLLDDDAEGLPYTGKLRGSRMLTLDVVFTFRERRRDAQRGAIGDLQALTKYVVD